ncbi:MAG: ribonuclease Z [Anaerolineae bacterium]|nr:ribonuclease Z [Anaerolineae bacterium]
MIELVFLGTSASAPSVHRGLSAQVVMYRDYRFLVDCGEGTQRQILQSGLGFKRLNKILLTHGHLDHILGLGGLISTFARWETIDHIEIYGGTWALERVRDLLYGVVLRGGEIQIKIDLIEVQPGIVLEDETFEVVAFPVIHRGPCLGYLFREKPRRPFINERAEALGVPRGPERRRLVAGESVTLADGRVIHPDDVLGPPQQGASLAFVGDASRVDNLVAAVHGVDMLVIEATYLRAEADMARRFGHLTAAQAARLALEAEVHRLVLTHISRRYHEGQILEEARAIFPDTVVARDFDYYRVLRRHVTTGTLAPGAEEEGDSHLESDCHLQES